MSRGSEFTITISDDEEDNREQQTLRDDVTVSQSSELTEERIQPRNEALLNRWLPTASSGSSPSVVHSASSPLVRPPKKRYTESAQVHQQFGSPQVPQVQQLIHDNYPKETNSEQPVNLNTRNVKHKLQSDMDRSVWNTIGEIKVEEIGYTQSTASVTRLSPLQYTDKVTSLINTQSSCPVSERSSNKLYDKHLVEHTHTSLRPSQGLPYVNTEPSSQPLILKHGPVYSTSGGVYYPHFAATVYPSYSVHHLTQPQTVLHPPHPSIVGNAQQRSVVTTGQSGPSSSVPTQQDVVPFSYNTPDVCKKPSENSPRSPAFISPVTFSALRSHLSRNSETFVNKNQQGVLREKVNQQATGTGDKHESLPSNYETVQHASIKATNPGCKKKSHILEAFTNALKAQEYVENIVDRSFERDNDPKEQQKESESVPTSQVSTPDSVIIESFEGPKFGFHQKNCTDETELCQSKIQVNAAEEGNAEESNTCSFSISETFSLQDCPMKQNAPDSECCDISPSGNTEKASCTKSSIHSNSLEENDNSDSGSAAQTEPVVLETFSLQPQGTCEDIKPGDACPLDELSKKAFYQCCIGSCVFSTVSPSEFEIHLVNVHSEADVFICVHCGYIASSGESLIEHLNEHVDEKHEQTSLNCNYSQCSYKTLKPDYLLRHIHLLHNEEEKHVCCKCNRAFENVLDLLMHIQGSFLSVVKCPHCSAKDVTKRKIIKHMNERHPDKGKLVSVSRYIVCKARSVTNWPISPPARYRGQTPVREEVNKTAQNSNVDAPNNLGSPEMPNITDVCYPKASEDPVLLKPPLKPMCSKALQRSDPGLRVQSDSNVDKPSGSRVSEEYVPIMSVKVAHTGFEGDKIKSVGGPTIPTQQFTAENPVTSTSNPIASSPEKFKSVPTIKREPADTGYNVALKEEPQDFTVKPEPVDVDESVSSHPHAPESSAVETLEREGQFVSPSLLTKKKKNHFQRVNVCNKCDFYTSSNGTIYKHLHLVHRIEDLFQCSECQKVVCQDDVIEHHKKYHPNADENYVPTSVTHGYRVKYMQKSVYKQAKERRFSKESKCPAPTSTEPVENIATGLIEKFSGAKEGEVVKLSSFESSVLDQMLRDKNLTSAKQGSVRHSSQIGCAGKSAETEPSEGSPVCDPAGSSTCIASEKSLLVPMSSGSSPSKRSLISPQINGSEKDTPSMKTSKIPPEDEKGKTSKRRRSRYRLTGPRKKRKRSVLSEQISKKKDRLDDSTEDIPVKKKACLSRESETRPEAVDESEVSDEGPECVEHTEEERHSYGEEAEENMEEFEKASKDIVVWSENSSETAEYQKDGYPNSSDEKLSVTEENQEIKKDDKQNNNNLEKCHNEAVSILNNSEAVAVCRPEEYMETETARSTNTEENILSHSTKKSLNKEKSAVKSKTPFKKKSLSNKESPLRQKSGEKTPLRSESRKINTLAKDEENLKHVSCSEIVSKTSPNKETPIKKEPVKVEDIKMENYTGPNLTFSQVNFDDPTYEFRCKYCTYRKGTLDKFLHHLYYHFHYRPYGCGHCSFKAFSHNRVLTHIKTDHPTEVNPIVERVENALLEARCQKTAMICFIPKHIEDVSLKIRLEKKKQKLLLKKQVKKEVKEKSEIKVKKEHPTQVQNKTVKPVTVKTTTKHMEGKGKAVKKSAEGSYLCPYCRTNRPMLTWTKLVIEICYHIHYKPFKCNYCSELETASTTCLQRHIEKHHPKKEVIIKEQRDPKREVKLKQLLQRSVDISKKHRQDLKMKELKEKAKKLKKKKKEAGRSAAHKQDSGKLNTKTATCTAVKKESEEEEKTGEAGDGSASRSSKKSSGPKTMSPKDMTIIKSVELFRESRDDYGVALYECLKCDYTIRNLKSMYTHSYRHQPKIFRCAYCDYSSYPRSAVSWHQKQVHSHIKPSVINLAETLKST